MIRCCMALLLMALVMPAMTMAGNPNPVFTPDPQIDKNMNRIADSLEDAIADLANKGLAAKEMGIVVSLLGPPEIKDAEFFRNQGGSISHRYSHAMFGYAGTIPANRIATLARNWGNNLCLIEFDAPLVLMMDSVVPQTRARPHVWDNFGLVGDAGTTIGIIDTGLDMTHPDLAGKLEFWHDFFLCEEPGPVDRIGHGTGVAGLAVGTGVVHPVHGNEPLRSLELTFFSQASNSGVSVPLGIPVRGDRLVKTEITWQGTGGQTCMEFGLPNQIPQGPRCSGTSPFIETWDLDFAGLHRFWVGFSRVPDDEIFSMQITLPYQQPEDGYNLMTGMAPGCRLAAAKICANTGAFEGFVSSYIAACDSFTAINSQINLKVANVSVGLNCDNSCMRYATDGLVNAGTVMTVSAGNSFPLPLGDPAKSQLAITVGAVDDFGLLNHYSSSGHLGENKPDVVAPGGCCIEGNYSVGLPVYLLDSNCSDGGDFPDCLPDGCPDDYSCGGTGTSLAAPLVAGLAALVIEALESRNYVWNYSLQDALLVKSLILMTATETNLPRNASSGCSPVLNRGGKDLNEGFGMINADAAIEAVLQDWPGIDTRPTIINFGDQPTDRRCWAASLISDGSIGSINLAVPPTLDADIYVYTANVHTDGNPYLLASSTNPLGMDENLVFVPTPGLQCYLTIKRISGFGEVSLSHGEGPTDKNMLLDTRLAGNFPNPFNPQTTIQFHVAQPQRVSLAVYDIAGRQVALLEDRVFESGLQDVVWDGNDRQGKAVAAGTYFVRLKTENRQEQQKVMLVR